MRCDAPIAGCAAARIVAGRQSWMVVPTLRRVTSQTYRCPAVEASSQGAVDSRVARGLQVSRHRPVPCVIAVLRASAAHMFASKAPSAHNLEAEAVCGGSPNHRRTRCLGPRRLCSKPRPPDSAAEEQPRARLRVVLKQAAAPLSSHLSGHPAPPAPTPCAMPLATPTPMCMMMTMSSHPSRR